MKYNNNNNSSSHILHVDSESDTVLSALYELAYSVLYPNEVGTKLILNLQIRKLRQRHPAAQGHTVTVTEPQHTSPFIVLLGKYFRKCTVVQNS